MEIEERSESAGGNMLLESESYMVMSLCAGLAVSQVSDGNCLSCEGYITVPCNC